jgi:16S rRNA (guanine966-N2)-methyltransferase
LKRDKTHFIASDSNTQEQKSNLRIISGDLRGKKLHPIRGALTRPTADRLRESIFNILFSQVRDAVVLDLFAGTGALGIEALSRGAEYAVFVEKQKDALSVIEQNLRSCRLENSAKIIRWDIANNLNCLNSPDSRLFNLVFMDPPYNRNLICETLRHLHRSGCLEKGATVVAEHSPPEMIPENIAEFMMTDQRKYGKTRVSFLEYVTEIEN